MTKKPISRRPLLAAGLLLPLGARVVSAAPPATEVTPALVEAATKEGKVTYYTAMDLSVAEPMAKAFEARYPGIKMTTGPGDQFAIEAMQLFQFDGEAYQPVGKVIDYEGRTPKL